VTQIAPPTADAPNLDAVVARSMPKVELHCHLEGAVRPATVAALARAHGVPLPVDDPTELFRFSNLAEFLDVFSLICSVLRTADDFRRITYEALADAVDVGVRYREMFFSPGFLLGDGVALDTIWDGIRAGLADAHADLDIRCRMILDIDKAAAPGAAVELVEFARHQSRDLLVGIGGDNTERGIDHRSFTPAFQLAERHGLRRTMHAGEDGPCENIAIALDDLGCERIDHGVRLGDDPELLARVAAERIPLTVCPISNVVLTGTVASVAAHPLVHQRAAGVLVTLNSDDPGMSGTTIADDYEQVAEAFGYDLPTMAQIALDGIEACWAPDDEKRALDDRFRREVTVLVPGWEAT
jgi:adenosine deaminase